MLVKAFSRPPTAATRRENSPGASLSVPLNIMCSNTWATPLLPSTSSIEPTRTHSMCTAVGARRSGLTITVRPLASLNWLTGLAAAAGGASCCDSAVDAKEALATSSSAEREGLKCMTADRVGGVEIRSLKVRVCLSAPGRRF